MYAAFKGEQMPCGQRDAGRGHRRQAAGRPDASPIVARAGRRHRAGRRGRHRAGDRACCSRSRRPSSRARAPPGSPRCCATRRASPAARSASCCAAATSTRMVLADIIERGMVRAGRLARIRVHTRDVPGELARVATADRPEPAPTSRKSHISGPSPRCRCRMRNWSSSCRRAGRSTSRKCCGRCAPPVSTPTTHPY